MMAAFATKLTCVAPKPAVPITMAMPSVAAPTSAMFVPSADVMMYAVVGEISMMNLNLRPAASAGNRLDIRRQETRGDQTFVREGALRAVDDRIRERFVGERLHTADIVERDRRARDVVVQHIADRPDASGQRPIRRPRNEIGGGSKFVNVMVGHDRILSARKKEVERRGMRPSTYP